MEPPFGEDLSPEAEEEEPLLETVTRKLLVNTIHAVKDSVIL
jgi:hypothetical protein